MPYKDINKQRAFQRNRCRRNRFSFFKGKKCVKCDSTKRLELDHIDPKTKVSHCIWSWSEERRNEELKKCQVLCKKCHKEKTKKEISKSTIHGTITAYKSPSRKCRCSLCKEAQRKYQESYRLLYK